MKILALAFWLFCSLGHAAELASGPAVLLQPEARLKTMALDARLVANYILAGHGVVALAIKPEKLEPSSGFIVYAVRAGGKSNA